MCEVILTKENERKIEVLAAAIHRQIEWQQNKMRLKQEMKIKRMIQSQLLSSQNRKNSLSN